ncbi:amino acid ABC transporter permease [Nesterenkonia sp. MY13]|uniref:Amino acid ABC transporter permease n=1 Tax=Nesterenkonia sedimenti TaxID=1463632 RepID=A0A7X8TIT1_9MICC|nr:amino acid ABC transporter permease [Nesterenkonia sedimenti]NLS09240.1 amino acid ABC transporter permease [Nesterenkonia sedimenti]
MENYLDLAVDLLPGLRTSIYMALACLAVGLPLGFLAGMALNSQQRWLRIVVVIFVEIFRGFPALLTLYLVYFGLTNFLVVGRFTSVVIAFGLTSAAYAAEIFRAAIASVPKGQLEAAQSLAFTRVQITTRVIIPHVLNVVVPPIIGIAIITFQGTALAYAIGARELLGSAYSIGMTDFRVLEPLMVAAALYLVVTSLLSWMEILADRRVQRITGKASRRRSGSARKRLKGKTDDKTSKSPALAR